MDPENSQSVSVALKLHTELETAVPCFLARGQNWSAEGTDSPAGAADGRTVLTVPAPAHSFPHKSRIAAFLICPELVNLGFSPTWGFSKSTSCRAEVWVHGWVGQKNLRGQLGSLPGKQSDFSRHSCWKYCCVEIGHDGGQGSGVRLLRSVW